LCGNIFVVEYVSNFINKALNLNTTKITKHCKSNVYYFRKSAEPAKNIIKFLYDDALIFLDRKRSMANNISNWCPKRQKGG